MPKPSASSTLNDLLSKSWVLSISRLLWALVLVTLPVTSFRFMPFMGSGTYVRPLALYPLALLLPVLLVRLRRGEIVRPWPGTLTILLAFMLAALAATAFGALLTPLELRGAGYLDRAVRAILTVMIGLAFFIAAAWMNQSEADLKFSVKWLLIGLAADLGWGAIQFIGLNSGHRNLLLKFQNLFSVRGLVKNKRISGFAYEPSWFAGQIATLYLPWLIAALLMGYRALVNKQPEGGPSGNFLAIVGKWIRPWLEPVLCLAAAAGLLMTYSRSGLLIAFLAAVFTFLLAGRQAISAAWHWVLAGFERQRWISFTALMKTAGIRVVLAFLILAVMLGSVVFLTNKGYIAVFFKSGKTDIFSFVQSVYLGPRLAYVSAAMQAFESHPLTGVGLGASGFWIYPNMPDWALSGDPEIAKQMSPNTLDLYPNSKVLYVRLLTETGLAGFMLFLAFYLSLFGDALNLLRSTDRAGLWLAAAGIFTLTAVFLMGISQDSFAMPEMWVNLGILAGAVGAFTHQPLQEVADSKFSV